MTTTPPAWQSHYHIILLDPTESRILLLPEHNSWLLPSFQKREPAHISDAHLITETMQRQLGLDGIVLYCAYRRVDRENARQELIYVLDMRNPSWIPPERSQWVGYETLAQLELMLPEQRTVIATCLHESEEIPPLRPPWARRGWFALAESWIQEQLTRLNYTIVAPIEQVKVWSVSCVLRVPTTHGNVYFKASLNGFMQTHTPMSSSDKQGILPLLFAHEPMLIQSLSARYPRHAPTLLAMDRERCWMLLAEFGTRLDDHADKTAQENALEVYSHMQVAATQHTDSLFAEGFLDRRLHILETQIDPLLNDEDALADLNRREVEQLRAYGPQLKTMCHQVANSTIPQTLVHGDLHTGNIAVQNDNYIYFDWTDGCVAHPFFDVLTFMEHVDDPVEQRRLRDIYLAQWTDFTSIEYLREVFPLSQMLATIHQAVSYQHMVANMEGTSKQAMRDGATYWLRILLQLFGGDGLVCYHTSFES
jgi:Phosphotransferase enzyme family